MSETKNIETLVTQWVRPEIKSLSAYHVPDASGLLKLDAMENPYAWSAELKEQWLGRLSQVEINRYPDPSSAGVEKLLYQTMSIPSELGVIQGNGSDEIIQILAMALGNPGAVILSPEPSFVMYSMIATFTHLNYVGVPLRANFELDLEKMLAAIAEHQPAIIFLAQPNNPTGLLYSEEDLKAILAAAPGVVVVDEAYMAFTQCNSIPLIAEFSNLLVMRTVSKIGLAGLRLGFMVGRREWIDELNKIRLPYNINVLTQASAEFALENYDVLLSQAEKIKEERQRLEKQLGEMKGFEVFPSEANFLLVRAPEGQARKIFEALKQHNVLIKCLDGGHPSLKDCLRVTVGTSRDSDRFMIALKDVLQEWSGSD